MGAMRSPTDDDHPPLPRCGEKAVRAWGGAGHRGGGVQGTSRAVCGGAWWGGRTLSLPPKAAGAKGWGCPELLGLKPECLQGDE